MNQPRIIVYGFPDTPYTQKVLRALRFKDLDFEILEPTRREDIRRWSPETGLLPVIEIGDERIGDSDAILDVLDARFPEPPLLSKDLKIAREQRRLATWVGETFRFYMIRWVAQRLGREEVAEATGPDGKMLGPLARMGLIGPDGRIVREAFDTSVGGLGPEFERRLDDLVGMLGDRQWFHGDRISRADLAVASALDGMYTDRYPGGQALLQRYPTLLRHYERVASLTD